MSFAADLELLIRARYPLIYILTSEELRAAEIVADIASHRQKRLYEWTCTGGLVPAGTSIQSRQRNAATRDPMVALEQVLEQVEPAIFLFKDFHPFLSRNNHTVVRKLRDIALHLKNSHKTLLFLSPLLELPPELEKETTVLNLPLPDRDDLNALLDRILQDLAAVKQISLDLDSDGRNRLLDGALGLTLGEAENVFARILVKHGRLGGDLLGEVLVEKQQLIRKNGLLEYLGTGESFEDLGGLQSLKHWLAQRACAFGPEARAFGLPSPKGILLLGVQGCGKSLSAKAISTAWQLPLLRFDMGRMFGSYVGSSEENVRRAIAVAESVAPAILWIDEIDKAFAGTQSSGATDGGTAARVFGTLLTWLAEKSTPVFVVATANSIAHLPPELLRKGRFDEIFFVDLPTEMERAEILAVHLRRRGRDPVIFDLEHLAQISEGFSGAELEQAVISGLFEAFASRENLASDHIANAIGTTVPLARTLHESITQLRDWANGRARLAGG
jgi:adenosyl cobinamide kinase/adenosyl cobinamide phosphate guanylyltransferase